MIKKHYIYIIFICLLLLKNKNYSQFENNLNQNINEEYRYNIYQLVVSPFHYLPANYFYPDKIIVSAKSTDDSFLNKILFYRLKDKYNRLNYKILNSLFPQINIISRLNIILPFQYGPSSFLALAVAANINKSYPQKSSALLKTATIYATGSYEYIINPKNKADEIKLLDYYSKNNFKITEIGKLKEKIASILKHVQDYQIESFLIILSKENKNTVTQFTNEIKEEVDYL